MKDPVLFLSELGQKLADKRKAAVEFAGYTAGNVLKANQLAAQVGELEEDKELLVDVLRDTASFLTYMADNV